MSKIHVHTATIKATGERITYLAKQSWGVRYYSFDDGATWHRTKSAAFKARSNQAAAIDAAPF